MFKYIFPFLSLLLFTACASQRLVSGDQMPIKLKKRSTNYLLKKMSANEVEADWFSAKARITFKDAEQTRKFTANIRMRKDSVIWLNIKKVSVEAFRILIKADSIYIINRLDKEYYVRSLDYVQERFNLPDKFQALQTAILGNPYFYEKQKLKPSIKNPQYQLTSGHETRILSEYLMNGVTFLLEQLQFLDLERDRKLHLELDDYRLINEKFNFAHNRKFTIDSEETGEAEIKMDFSKVEIDVPKEIRFSVSSRYKRVE